jgi:hypothetical protein
MKIKTIGSSPQCDLVLANDTVSDIHAQVQLTHDGFLTVVDAGSEHGSFVERNGQWARVLKVGLGSNDRIRCGELPVELKQLVDLFGERVRVQLRDNQHLRMPALLAERLADEKTRVVLERPRRNPETGDIEEDIK